MNLFFAATQVQSNWEGGDINADVSGDFATLGKALAEIRGSIDATPATESIDALPEKWCIERTPENADMVNEWANANYGKAGKYFDNKGWIHSEPIGEQKDSVLDHFGKQDGYTEITTDKFRNHVLNQPK